MAASAKSAPSFSETQQKHISVQRYFEVSLLLMLGTAFLTLASTGKLDSISILLFAVAIGIKLWSYARGESGYRLRSRTITYLSLAYVVFFIFDLTLSGGGLPARLLPAGVHLILFVTVMKIFSARRYRDYGYLAALSFLMLLVSAVLAAGAGYLIGLALYVLFAISMFISYDIKRGIEKAGYPPRGPFREPAQNRVAVENALAVTALGLAVAIALVGTLLFFLIPRYHAAYLGRLGMQAGNVTGFSESVNLSDLGKIKRSNMVVMRIKPQGDPRRFQGVYWRGVALARFSGRTWYNESWAGLTRVEPLWQGRFVLPPVPGVSRRNHRLLNYQVLLAGVSSGVLFAAAQPIEISGGIAGLDMDETGSLHDPRQAGMSLEYKVTSDAGLPPARDLRSDTAEMPAAIEHLYLSLPAIDPRIPGLARRVTSTATNNYDRALGVQNYLRENFGYTLDPPSIQPSNPVGSFLFVSRRGYCAYFSAAMTLMLRTLGIPARVVNGFQTGEYNRVGNDFIVRARDAHSWVEAYFPTYGWVPFDPTPAAGEESAVSGWSTLGDYVDAFSLFWNEWVVSYDFQHQAALGERAARESHQARRWISRLRAHAAHRAKSAARTLRGHLLASFLVALAIASGILTFRRRAELRYWWFRYRLHAGAGGESVSHREAAIAYRRYLRILRRKGFVRAPAQTPREFALSLPSSPAAGCAAEFTELYNTLRYGNQPIPRERLAGLLAALADRDWLTGVARQSGTPPPPR